MRLILPGRPGNLLPHSRVNRHVWVDSVTQLIAGHDLQNIVLVGHSYGGLTITGVALKIPHRIKQCIYATALVPPEEGSLADEFPRLVTPAMASAMQPIDGGICSIMGADYFRQAFIQNASRDLQDFCLCCYRYRGNITNSKSNNEGFYALEIPTSYVILQRQ